MSTNFFLKNKGYKIINFLKINEISDLLVKISHHINNSIKKNEFNKKNLKYFHKKNISTFDYSKITNSKNRKISLDIKLFKKQMKNSKLLGLIKPYWGHSNVKIIWVGSAKKNQVETNKAGFRIARPKVKSDAATEHIDSYNNDEKSFLTVWIPLIGFGKNYSLKLYPGTHKILHLKKNFEKKTKYISRVFKKNYYKKLNSIRPNLKPGQAIIFHPNLIHGGSKNNGSHTRISIEVRLFNKNRFNLKKTFDKKLVN
jgi:hypothetical protein